MRPHVFARLFSLVLFAALGWWAIADGLKSDPPFSGNGEKTGLYIFIGMTVVIMPLIWFSFRPPRAARREFRDADIGIGTLVAAEHTGSSTNDQPHVRLHLDVETRSGHVLRSSTVEIIDLTALPQLVPGATMTVRYLPDQRIALDTSISDAQMTDVLYESRLRTGRMTAQQVNVARNGYSTQAVVMAAQPTGDIVDGLGVIRLDLRVNRPDGTKFDATREMPLPPIALPGLQPGAVVEARYMPGDESYVAVETRVK